ncbi:MAG: glycosyltransferase family 39 protein [Candidatus Omnitrophota bacterium]
MEGIKTLRNLVLLIIIASFIFLWNLGTGSLSSWDEGLYAEVSREMFNSGNLLNLTWAGQPWSDKPPLYMWVTVFFYKLFGINEFSVRLFSAICGIGTVIIVYLFANMLYSRRAASASALILLSTWHFLWAGKIGMLDAAITFFITLSLFLFKLGEENQLYLFFSCLVFTLAFLTKSFAALLIPLILFFYIILTKKFKLILRPALWIGVVISLAILGWWHLQAFSNYGKDFVGGYFIRNLFTRTTQALEGHSGTIFTYLEVLPNKGRPWAAIGLFALLYAIWRMVINNRNKELMLPAIWALVVLIVFSVVKTKLHWYIVPIYPALSMLVGWGMAKIFKKITVFIIVIFTLASILYLSADKKIFNLDYSPEIKKIAITVRNIIPENKRIYLYNIGDPGIQFYFGDIRENIAAPEILEKLMKEKNRYFIFEINYFASLDKLKFLKIIETKNFVVVKTK